MEYIEAKKELRLIDSFNGLISTNICTQNLIITSTLKGQAYVKPVGSDEFVPAIIKNDPNDIFTSLLSRARRISTGEWVTTEMDFSTRKTECYVLHIKVKPYLTNEVDLSDVFEYEKIDVESLPDKELKMFKAYKNFTSVKEEILKNEPEPSFYSDYWTCSVNMRRDYLLKILPSLQKEYEREEKKRVREQKLASMSDEQRAAFLQEEAEKEAEAKAAEEAAKAAEKAAKAKAKKEREEARKKKKAEEEAQRAKEAALMKELRKVTVPLGIVKWLVVAVFFFVFERVIWAILAATVAYSILTVCFKPIINKKRKELGLEE